MYPLAPLRSLTIALTLFFLLARLVYYLLDRLNIEFSDWSVASVSTAVVLALLKWWVGSHRYYSLWRMMWRFIPALNKYLYPDINGIWVGRTVSNWPRIKSLFEYAQSNKAITEAKIQSIPDQEDRIVLEIRASLFSINIDAYLESTAGSSRSIAVRPFWCDQKESLHLAYIYKQEVPDPILMDESAHLGAAELVFSRDNLQVNEGVYWTRRKWKQGLNTAGKIVVERVACRRSANKSLSDFL